MCRTHSDTILLTPGFQNIDKTKEYHSANHDDFGSDVSRHKEDIHEAQTEEGKRDRVHHPGPDKILSVRCVAHNDRDRQQTVHNCVKLVPGTLKVAIYFMLQGERMRRNHLKDVMDRIKHFSRYSHSIQETIISTERD